jgi:cytochrome c biogenesis protein CcmG/thiol:disulfide interchange protein DsbE
VLARALQHRYALRGAVVALIVAVVVFGLLSSASHHPLAPPLPRAALRGETLTLAALRGRAVAIAFVASWCPGCRTEAPALERFAVSPAGRGRLLAIDSSDPVSRDARAFVSRYHWTFTVLNDASGATGDAYGVAHLPTTVILNADGRIVARDSGPQTVASLERALRAAG